MTILVSVSIWGVTIMSGLSITFYLEIFLLIEEVIKNPNDELKSYKYLLLNEKLRNNSYLKLNFFSVAGLSYSLFE